MTRRLSLAIVMAAAAALVAGPGGGDEAARDPQYRVTEVKRKLLRELPEPELRLEEGVTAHAGDTLRTGWRSWAEIVSVDYGARFRIASRTRVRLATERPGVLLELEKGRLRALFDKLAGEGSADRIVTTPSAVLAVRGTEYGVEVSSSGDTSVTVFAGEVEVVDVKGRGKAVRVGAGQYCTVRRGQPASAPRPHSVSPRDWDRGRGPDASGSQGSRSQMGRPDSPGMGPGSPSSGGSGTPRQPQGGGGRGRG